MLRILSDWFRTLFPSPAPEFRTEIVRIDHYTKPLWAYSIRNPASTRKVRTGSVEAASPSAALAMIASSVEHGHIVEIDGLRYRIRRNALPTLMDPATRSAKGDRAAYRRETV